MSAPYIQNSLKDQMIMFHGRNSGQMCTHKGNVQSSYYDRVPVQVTLGQMFEPSTLCPLHLKDGFKDFHA